MAIIDGRQVADTIDGIRGDHVQRYKFAAKELKGAGDVLDAACGCGYGSSILMDSGVLSVEAIDAAPAAIEYAVKHYSRPNISWRIADLTDDAVSFKTSFRAAVSFETIEHLADPSTFLETLAAYCDILIASVPNQEILPFQQYRFPDHHRHYTPLEFESLLSAAGWHIKDWFHQKDAEPGIIRPGSGGRTMIVYAET